MAWNKYYIVVTAQPGFTPGLALTTIGLTGYRAADQVSFHQTNKSDDLFIGTYKDNLVIVQPDLTYAFFKETPSDIEKQFVAAFPNAEIAALAENSTVDEFGYNLIQNGRRIRVKHGCDGEIYTDIGDMLPEEEAILAGVVFDRDELEHMAEDLDAEEIQEIVSFEASWRVPAVLSKRYFGDIIDNLDEKALMMTRYRKVESQPKKDS